MRSTTGRKRERLIFLPQLELATHINPPIRARKLTSAWFTPNERTRNVRYIYAVLRRCLFPLLRFALKTVAVAGSLLPVERLHWREDNILLEWSSTTGSFCGIAKSLAECECLTVWIDERYSESFTQLNYKFNLAVDIGSNYYGEEWRLRDCVFVLIDRHNSLLSLPLIKYF